MAKNKKVLKVRRYKAGYEIRTELVDGSEFGGSDFEIKSAYTHSGDYIGNPKFAYRLCKKWGIKPEKISPDSNICSIGFCEEEQKWYGYSHRAMCGFGIGSKVKKGDCAYTPGCSMELYGSLSKDQRERVVKMDGDGIMIERTVYDVEPVNPNEPQGELRCVNPSIEFYVVKPGRGEWTAETLEDAKQMAIDFARDVA